MNLKTIFHNRYFEILISLFLLLGVIIVISTPDIPFFKWTASFAMQTTVLYVLLGIFFLLISQERLLFLTFFCAACLSKFLKGNFNPNLKLPVKSQNEVLTTAFIKLEQSDTGEVNMFEVLKQNPDLICFNKPTNVDNKNLFKLIKKEFHYSIAFSGRSFEQIIYSKYPFVTADTILLDGNPQVLYSMSFPTSKENVYFINTFFSDPLHEEASTKYRFNLGRLIVYLRPIKSPLIVAGDFNSVSWSGELNYFKKSLNLEDSRRAFYPSLPNLLETPKDHIFYTDKFSCVDFHEFREWQGRHLGISSSFQINNGQIQANKINQTKR